MNAPMPGNTLIMLPAYRGEMPCRPLLQWLRALAVAGWRWMPGPSEARPVPVCRNQMVRWFLDDYRWAEYLVQVNPALVPLPSQTVQVLRTPGEVVYARVPGRQALGGHRGGFDTACFRVHRSVYEAMTPPWFGFKYSDDGVVRTACECTWFHNHLPDGVVPRAAGAIGRRVERVAAFAGDREAVRLLVPEDLPEGQI